MQTVFTLYICFVSALVQVRITFNAGSNNFKLKVVVGFSENIYRNSMMSTATYNKFMPPYKQKRLFLMLSTVLFTTRHLSSITKVKTAKTCTTTGYVPTAK